MGVCLHREGGGGGGGHCQVWRMFSGHVPNFIGCLVVPNLNSSPGAGEGKGGVGEGRGGVGGGGSGGREEWGKGGVRGEWEWWWGGGGVRGDGERRGEEGRGGGGGG